MKFWGPWVARVRGRGFRIPSYRPDLSREIDLIEEISRIEGMSNVRGTLSLGVAARSTADSQYDREWELRRFLNDLGYIEWVTNSLHPRQEAGQGAIDLINPLTEDYARLRGSLLETALPCVRHNLSHGAESVKAFEIGTVYRQVKGRAIEEKKLLVLGAGLDRAGHWAEKGRSYDYFCLKGLAEHLTRFFPELTIRMDKALVPDSILKAQGIKIPVFSLEIALKFPGKKTLPQYGAISHFPLVRRDLALVVDRSVRNEQILEVIHSLKIRELQEAECFDVFQDDRGEKLAADKKSLAYALTYRSPERTLIDKEVNGWQEMILTAVQQKVGATLR